jgi:hypothetical protein
MLLLAADATDYRGSIGPTRARSVARLNRNPELRELHLASF